MSGLYNMIFGVQPAAPYVLSMLGAEAASDFGRFRDAWFERDEQGVPRMVVYTRNGGPNREDHEDDFERWREHECYVADRDEEYDSTYALLYFSVPEAYQAQLEDALPADDRPLDTAQRWRDALAAMNGSA